MRGDLGTLPFGGGAGQRPWGTGAWRIGFEGGALGSWKRNTTRFRRTGNGSTSVQIKVDSTYYSLGLFMGGVVSVNLTRYVRLYADGGPSLTWAWLRDDDNNDNTTTTGVDFSFDDAGDLKLDEPLYLLTIGAQPQD